MAAVVYDCLVLAALLMVATALWLAFSGEAVAAGDPWFRAYLLLLVGAYFFAFWRAGQTLGMRAWRLHVERAGGGRLRGRDALLRVLAAAVSWAALGMGFLSALVDREQRTWHDRLSGTRLVVVPRPRAARAAGGARAPKLSARD